MWRVTFEVWYLFSECVESLEGHTATSEDSPSNGRMRCRAQLRTSFVVLVKKLWCGQFSSLHPKAFKVMLGLVHPPFTGSRQVYRYSDIKWIVCVMTCWLLARLSGVSGRSTGSPSWATYLWTDVIQLSHNCSFREHSVKDISRPVKEWSWMFKVWPCVSEARAFCLSITTFAWSSWTTNRWEVVRRWFCT